eukprot:IDg23119t1
MQSNNESALPTVVPTSQSDSPNADATTRFHSCCAYIKSRFGGHTMAEHPRFVWLGEQAVCEHPGTSIPLWPDELAPSIRLGFYAFSIQGGRLHEMAFSFCALALFLGDSLILQSQVRFRFCYMIFPIFAYVTAVVVSLVKARNAYRLLSLLFPERHLIGVQEKLWSLC